MKHFLKLLLLHIIYFVVMITISTHFGYDRWVQVGASLIPYIIVTYVDLLWVQKNKLTSFQKFWLTIYWASCPISPIFRIFIGIYFMLVKKYKEEEEKDRESGKYGEDFS